MKEIVIVSGKGGTGKTSISSAFATMQDNMLVADCDVDAANLHLILNPQNYREEIFVSGKKAIVDPNKCKLCAQCADLCRFEAISCINSNIYVDETLCEGCALCAKVCPSKAISMSTKSDSRWYSGTYRNGVLIHARLAPGEENSGKLVSKVREEARKEAIHKNVNHILIDGPPGIGCPVIASLTGVSLAIIITEPSKSGYHDLKRIAKLCESFHLKTGVIINKFNINPELSDLIRNWCIVENIPLLGNIPFDKEITQAMIACKSIIEYNPQSETSKSLHEIYQNIINQ